MRKLIIQSLIIFCFLIVGKAQKQQNNFNLSQSITCLATNGSNIFAGTYDAGVFLSSNNGVNWVSVNKGLTYYVVNSIIINGGDIFAGTSKGVFMSSNNGSSWMAINEGLTNTNVHSLATNNGNIYAGTSAGVFKSTDHGDHWVSSSAGLYPNISVYSLAICGSNIFAGTFGDGIYFSSNNGSSWTKVNKGLRVFSIGSFAVIGSNIFAGSWGDGVYLSSNNGENWTPVNTGLPSSSVIQSMVVSGNNIFVGTIGQGVYLSSNNGNKWIEINKGLTNYTVNSLLVSGSNVFAGTDGGICLTLDNGSSWFDVNNGLIKEIAMATTITEMANWDKYPTYGVYESMMTKFQTDYPNLFKRYDLVTLGSGHKLIVGKLTSNVNTKTAKPQFLYSSTMHGKEPVGLVTMLRFIDYLLKNYGTDSHVSNIVDNIELWILPVSNPDGTYREGNYTVSGASRFNANNIDLNRNYPNPLAGAHPDGSSYQKETQTLMNFADTMNFVMSANFHSGHEYICFPWESWNSSSRKHADDDWWRLVCKEFADSCQKYGHLNSMPNYFTEYPSGTIFGGDEKLFFGTRQEYMNYYKHCREVTVEVSHTYIVGSNLLPNYWNSLYRSILHFPEQCLNGIQGIVTDSCTGKPIRAKVFVNNHDIDSSWVYSGSKFGNYYRPIKSGVWSVTYSSTGYKTKTIDNIISIDGSAVIKNIKLIQTNPDSSFTYSINANTLSFASSSNNAVSYLWDFGDGATSNEKNPSHTYLSNGAYTIKLTVANDCGIRTSSHKVINLSVGIKDEPFTNGIEISPNPTNSFFMVKIITDKCEDARISIVDIIGNKVYEKDEKLYTGSNRFKIDISNNRQGVYIINIVTSRNNHSFKILKKDSL